ncbi:MAG: bifunctional diaminohydroxyphosphoribosylaminopyrimidine deaminase/5-amino-6-(5-phosphoribosylamino)uracil reductase RibD [Verrucomicrobiae bacterium]|nr:bifunctional diaminohydroxyphosphoribosylaminopyrimidine deaminase/5-amino-6-(5-phosphoribosylamino)uracil reductase RibD [Verrucomicrobiae bacterium]
MRRALALAKRGIGRTSPNPCVGAVIVQDGRILGEGWHRAAGQPHAEIEAIRDAARRGHRRLSGATLHVTLEPCSTHGRTPPCTDAILAAGLRRVVVGAVDPNPAHAGRGLRRLRRAGVRVERDPLAAECAALNEAWNRWMVEKHPWVIAKAAMSLDGKIATTAGASRWITGKKAREAAHRLRATSDAVLVGIGTLLADDPALTARDARGRPLAQQPLRAVLDSFARTPPSSRLIGADPSRVRILVGPRAPEARVARLTRTGARVVRLPSSKGSPSARVSLHAALRALAREGMIRLLVEGGGEILASFFEAGLVDEAAFFIAPKILGGAHATRAVAGAGFRRWRLGPLVSKLHLARVGSDLLARGRIVRRLRRARL